MINVINNVNLGGASNKVKSALYLYGDTAAKKLEATAKGNAPWIDRSSNARNSIQGKFEAKPGVAKIDLSGNVEYFVYLEFAMEKRYAILIPTINQLSTEILRGYQKVVDSL